MGNALLSSNPHFENLVRGKNAEYETELPGENPLITRSFGIIRGTVVMSLPAGTVFQRVEATANAKAHTRAVVNNVHVILPEGVDPWTGDKVVDLELRANSVEPKNVTRPCWRNWRIVLDNVRPSRNRPAGRLSIGTETNAKITTIEDGRIRHNGACVTFPITGEISDSSRKRGAIDSDRVHAPERGDGTGFFYR